MSYQKRVIIFLAVMGVTSVVLLAAFGFRVSSSLDSLSNEGVVPQDVQNKITDFNFSNGTNTAPSAPNATSSTTTQENTTTTTTTQATTTLENATSSE